MTRDYCDKCNSEVNDGKHENRARDLSIEGRFAILCSACMEKVYAVLGWKFIK